LTEKEFKFSDFKIEIENFYLTLAKIGIHKNEVVGIFAGNSPEYLFLCLACWKLGAIICPLNPAYKRGNFSKKNQKILTPILGEFEKYFKEVGISWLFTENEYLDKFENVDIIAKNV
jgi:acyl-CoA synthetase (AMP-forming)/AMP-acid ligase II